MNILSMGLSVGIYIYMIKNRINDCYSLCTNTKVNTLTQGLFLVQYNYITFLNIIYNYISFIYAESIVYFQENLF
jgi:hypothetical protein